MAPSQHDLSWGANKFKVLGIIFNIDLEQMIKDNYTSKLKHIENITKRWGKRALTPIRKITVIKTFMISAFNHLFLSLPNPHKRVIDHINNILFTFLWNNKPNKIKTSVITKQYSEGGLQMINLNFLLVPANGKSF